MVKMAIVADDLTGANDTAVQFAKKGMTASVQINSDKAIENDVDIIVINTDSRDLNEKAAYQKVKLVAENLKANQVEHIYKKIDSTLRGNFAAEIAAISDVYQPELIVIAPAYPDTGRITVDGYHFLNGIPLEMTEIANSPKTPVHESYIPGIIEKQVGEKVGLITMTTIKSGSEKIRKTINSCIAAGKKWIVFDVVHTGDFLKIMQAASIYHRVLWVGSAGMANNLSLLYNWPIKNIKKSQLVSGNVLIVAGSVSHKTQEQTTEIINHQKVAVVQLDMEKLVNRQNEEIQRCTGKLQTAISSGCDTLLVSGLKDKDVETAVNAGKNIGMSGKEVSEYTAVSLAEITQNVDLASAAGIILTGGDTAVHVLKKLGVDSIEIISEVATGIPLGRLHGGSCDGMKVVTKAGAFGDKDCFLQAINAIHQAV